MFSAILKTKMFILRFQRYYLAVSALQFYFSQNTMSSPLPKTKINCVFVITYEL
jgi:hypothetical protein